MIQDIKSHVQSFITLTKDFVTNKTYDDNKTNDGDDFF